MPINQRQRSTEILVVDVHHIRVGDLPRGEKRSLRGLDTGAGFLVPVRQMVQPVQLVKVPKLLHPCVAGVHGGILRKGTVSLDPKTEKQKIGGVVSLFCGGCAGAGVGESK